MRCPNCGYETDKHVCPSCQFEIVKPGGITNLDTKPTVEKKKLPVLGVISAVAAAIYSFGVYSNMQSASSSSNGWEALGGMIASSYIRPYLTMCVISCVCGFIGVFSKIKWFYLGAAALVVVGALQLPAIVGFPTDAILIIALDVGAFAVEYSKEKKT